MVGGGGLKVVGLKLRRWSAKVRGDRLCSPVRRWRTKAVNYWRLVGIVPAFVLPDICYTSPAASWRLRLTACGNNASPVSDPLLQPSEVLSDPSGTLVCGAAKASEESQRWNPSHKALWGCV